MTLELAAKSCVPCRRGAPPLTGEALVALAAELGEGWAIAEGRLEKEFKFKDFREAMRFANVAAAIADAEDHHPDLHVSWGKVRVILWTHKAGGLTQNDFILAAKIDATPHVEA